MAQVQVSQQTNTIDTIIERLKVSKFTDSSKFTSLVQVNEALNAQKDHLNKIIGLRDKISEGNSSKFTSSGAAQQIINKYLKFIDYIIALIEAKIQKDEAMKVLLTNTFNYVKEFIGLLEQSKNQLTSKTTTIKVLQNIGITDEDLKLNIFNLGLNNAEKPEGIINTVDKGNIAQLVTKIIENCQARLESSITTFTNELNQMINKEGGNNQGGGNGNPNTDNNGIFISLNDNYNLNTYQKSFKDIKKKYEEGLKDNIRVYREICETLLNDGAGAGDTPPGILKIIMESVNKLIVVNKEITKRFGFKLGLFQDKPFADNKEAFEALKNEINIAKDELLNTPDRQNPQNLPGTQGNQAKTVIKQGEKVKDGSQPIKDGFRIFLENLEGANDNDLEPYRSSLLESLRNIKTALDESINKEGSAKTTGSPNSNIAYAFGWNDPIGDPNNPTYISGNWSYNELSKGKPPTGLIELYIKLLEQLAPDKETEIDKSSLITTTEKMIELLQYEKLSTEKGRALQGTNNVEFNETLKEFIPQKPLGASSSTSTGGGYKKKSKSKKMTSKKKSMKVAKKTSSKAKENKNKNKKIVKSYSKSKSKKQSGGFIRGGVLFPQDFYDTSTVM